MSNLNMTACDAMSDKTVRIPDLRLERLGGDIERLSSTLQKIETNELDKKLGLDLLIGFAETLIQHATAMNRPVIFNRTELSKEEQAAIIKQCEADGISIFLARPVVKYEEMTEEEKAIYFLRLKEEIAKDEAKFKAQAEYEESVALANAERIREKIENSCLITFDIDGSPESIISDCARSECAGGEVDEDAVAEFKEIVSEPLDPGELSGEERAKKEAEFLEGVIEEFANTLGDKSKGFSLLGRSSDSAGE